MRTIQMSFSEQNPGRQFYGYRDELNATEFVCDCTKIEQDHPGVKVLFAFMAPNKTSYPLTQGLTPDENHKVSVKLTRTETAIAGPVGVQAHAYLDDTLVTMTAIYPGDIAASTNSQALPPDFTPTYIQQLNTNIAKTAAIEEAFAGITQRYPRSAKYFNSKLLDGKECMFVGVLGDSLSNDTSDWVHLLAQKVSEKYENYNVKYASYDYASSMFTGWEEVSDDGNDRHWRILDSKSIPNLNKSDVPLTSADLDITIRLSLDSWSDGTEKYLFCRYGSSGAYCWFLRLNANNSFAFYWSTDGTTLEGSEFSSSSTTSFVDGQAYYLRVTLDADNGSSGYTLTFMTSTDGGTWTTVQTITGGSTTSIYDHATQPYAIGGKSSYSNMVGNIYEAIIRDGISGPIVNPQPIDLWRQTASDEYSVLLEGTPVVYFYNGAVVGWGNEQYKVQATIKKTLPPTYNGLIFVCLSHNDGYTKHDDYLTDFNTIIGYVKNQCVYPYIVLVTQNPKILPAEYIVQHSIRRLDQIAYANANGIEVIDAGLEFKRDARGLSVLINADGVHPTTADGQPLICDTVWKFFNIFNL